MSKDYVARKRPEGPGVYPEKLHSESLTSASFSERSLLSGKKSNNAKQSIDNAKGITSQRSIQANKGSKPHDVPVSLTFVRKPVVTSQLDIPTPISPNACSSNSPTGFKTIPSLAAQITPFFAVDRESSLLLPGGYESFGEDGIHSSANHVSSPGLLEDSDSDPDDVHYFDASDVVSPSSLQHSSEFGNMAEAALVEEKDADSNETSSRRDLLISKPQLTLEKRKNAFSLSTPVATDTSSPFKEPIPNEDEAVPTESNVNTSGSLVQDEGDHLALAEPVVNLQRDIKCQSYPRAISGKRGKFRSSLIECGLSRLTDPGESFREKSANALPDSTIAADRTMGETEKVRAIPESEKDVIPFLGKDLTPHKADKPSKRLTLPGIKPFVPGHASQMGSLSNASQSRNDSVHEKSAQDTQSVSAASTNLSSKKSPQSDSLETEKSLFGKRHGAKNGMETGVVNSLVLPVMSAPESKTTNSSPEIPLNPLRSQLVLSPPTEKERETESMLSLVSPITPALLSVPSSDTADNSSNNSLGQRHSNPLINRSESVESSGGGSTTSSNTSERRARHKRKKKLISGGGLGRLLRANSSGSNGPRLGEIWTASNDSSPIGSGDAPISSNATSGLSPIEEGDSRDMSESSASDGGSFSIYDSAVNAVDSLRSIPFDALFHQDKKYLSKRESHSSSGDKEPVNSNKSAMELEKVLQRAHTGKSHLTDVLNAMYIVSTRVENQTIDFLYKYLSSPTSVEACVRILRKGGAPDLRGGLQFVECGDVRINSNPYHYVLVQAFVNGQAQFRKSLLSNYRARGELFAFFEDNSSAFKKNQSEVELQVHGMVKILSSLLRESPTEMADHVGTRKGFLVSLVQNHIGIKAVAEFVVELCAGNALSVSETSDELRYGSPNTSGIVLLAREKVLELLVEIFESCTDVVLLGGLHAAKKRAREEGCLYCVLEISKRTLVIPRYDKKNCSYGGRRIKLLNACLSKLSVFEDSQQIAQMMHFAFGGLFGTPGDRGVSLVATLQTVTELLNTVHAGTKSKLASTRIQMGKMPTASLEGVILSHIGVLSRLVTLEVGQRGSLQQLRLTIIETMTSLFRTKNASTRLQLARSEIPHIFFNLVSTMEWSSIMQSKIIMCIRLTFERTEGEGVQELQQAWITAMENGSALWRDILPKAGEESRSSRGYYGAYMEIGLILREFADRDGGCGKAKLQRLMSNSAAYQEFQKARGELLDEMARLEGDPIAGPKPEKTTASLLASAASLSALSLDNIDAI